MSTAARRRLMRDLKRLQSDPPQGVQGAPLDNNVGVVDEDCTRLCGSPLRKSDTSQ